MIRAVVSQVRGIAVFSDGAGFHCIDARFPETTQPADELAVAKLLGDAPDLEPVEAADVTALRNHVRLRRRREEALYAALVVLDRSNSSKCRSLAADTLLSVDASDWKWVQGVLASAPLPDSADPHGSRVLAPHFEDDWAALENAQPVVRTVCTAWNALAERNFAGVDRVSARAKAVRYGVFLNLAYGKPPSDDNPFAEALAEHHAAFEQAAGLRRVSPARRQMERLTQRVPSFMTLWQALPWRTSWQASEWPTVEARSACQLASRLRVMHLSTPAAVVMVHAEWNQLTEEAGMAMSVERSVVTFASSALDFGPRERTLSGVRALIHRIAATSGAELLPRLVAPIVFGYETAFAGVVKPLHGLRSSQLKAVLVAMGAVASRVQNALSPSMMRAQFLLSTTGAAKARLLAEESAAGQGAAGTDALRNSFGITALERIFQRNGCVVHVLSEETRAGKRSARALLINYRLRTHCEFSGEQAWLFVQLQRRFTADLESGLPLEDCGWSSPGKHSYKVYFRTTSQMIRAIRNVVTKAGLAREIIEGSEERVRLNPRFATAVSEETPESSH